jgi:acetyl esterase/lipase
MREKLKIPSMKSLTFYVTILIIKLKGVKKTFSQSPVDYQRLRKGDVHSPKSQSVSNLSLRSFIVLKTTVTEISPNESASKDVIIYCPGGSFVSGPASFNWNSIFQLVKDTGAKAYLIDYPKAPEHKIGELNKNVDEVYQHIAAMHPIKNIILLGGSVGGTLMALLVQRLIKNNQPVPKKLILITPVMDCSMTNPMIDSIEKRDVMYSRIGVLSAKHMCAGSIDLKSDAMSPLYGSVKYFPPTLIFVAEEDIQRPDAEIFCEKLRNERVTLILEYGKGMPHIWPLLPVMREAKKALKLISEFILE